MMKFNHPIAGHALINEGHMHGVTSADRQMHVIARGGCQCGYQPIGWQSMAINKVKRWHREHKEAIRAGEPAPAVGIHFYSLTHTSEQDVPELPPPPKTAAEWMRQPFV